MCRGIMVEDVIWGRIIFCFSLHKKVFLQLRKLRFNHWCHMDCLPISLLRFWAWEYFSCAAIYAGSESARISSMMDFFLTNTAFSCTRCLLVGRSSIVDYCDVFISSLDTHSDGTHSLQRIHWWASNVMLHFSKPFQIKKLIYILDGWKVSTFSENFHFWVNNSFQISWYDRYKNALLHLKCLSV